jgi:hypothetical protein
MGIFSRLFGGHKSATATPPKPTKHELEGEQYIEAAKDVECPHTALAPHWANAADMGHQDKVTSYRCDVCGRTFSPSEAQELRATETERLEWMKDIEQADSEQPADSPPGAQPSAQAGEAQPAAQAAEAQPIAQAAEGQPAAQATETQSSEPPASPTGSS